jgi:hypothetical protein
VNVLKMTYNPIDNIKQSGETNLRPDRAITAHRPSKSCAHDRNILLSSQALDTHQQSLRYQSTHPTSTSTQSKQPKWSNSKKSWTRSSSARKKDPMTKTTGTPTPVQRPPSTSLHPILLLPHPLTPFGSRIRHLFHRLATPRRILLRAPLRFTRHNPRLHPPLSQLKIQHSFIVA